MGMFQVRVRVSNPGERSRFFEESFWVDTGALYSFIPEGRLNEIGIGPLRTRELILADGRRDRPSQEAGFVAGSEASTRHHSWALPGTLRDYRGTP